MQERKDFAENLEFREAEHRKQERAITERFQAFVSQSEHRERNLTEDLDTQRRRVDENHEEARKVVNEAKASAQRQIEDMRHRMQLDIDKVKVEATTRVEHISK